MIQMKLKVEFLVVACIQIIALILVTTTYALDLKPKIDPLARPLIEDGTAVGFMIGIVKDGQTQVIAYGEIAKGSNTAPNADTVYEIGSVSKVFTAILLSDMVRKGIVKLDDPVQKYLPTDVKMPDFDGKSITLEHLVTHTSGLPRLPDNLKPANLSNPYADYSESQMYEFLNGHKLRRPPGQYEYSNYGVGLLGHLLARKMGKTYEQSLIDKICKPLGMLDTCISLNEDQKTRLATPYNAALNPVNTWDVPTLAGAGAIRSTCNDMMKFIQANIKDNDEPLTQTLRMSHQERHAIMDGMTIGMAWHINPDDTRWHNGGTGGFFSWLGISLTRKVGIVVLANTFNMRLDQFGQKVMRVALGEEVEPIESRKVIDVSSEVLESYAGVYTLTPNFSLTVTVEDGKLMVQATGQGKIPFFPESKTKFFCKVVEAQISIVLDEDGKVDHLILHQGGFDQKAFPRKAIHVSSEVLESYTGEYMFLPNYPIRITLEDGKLMVHGPIMNNLQLFPVSKTRFFLKGKDTQISFVPDKDGKINYLIHHYPGGINQKFARKGTIKPREVIDVSPDVLEPYTGVYRVELNNTILTVTVEAGRLMMSLPGEKGVDKFQLFPESKTKFFFKEADTQISFVPDQDGNIDYLIVHMGGPEYKAIREGDIKQRKVIDVSPEVLESYAGVYKVPSSNSTLTVTVEDGKLMVQPAGDEKEQVFPESNTKFFYKEMESIQISFVPDEDGRINHLIVHVGSNEYEGFRENEDF